MQHAAACFAACSMQAAIKLAACRLVMEMQADNKPVKLGSGAFGTVCCVLPSFHAAVCSALRSGCAGVQSKAG